MADNFVTNTASGGVVFASDEITSVHHPYVKVEFGANDSATPVSSAAPFPVTLVSETLAGNLDVNLAASAATVTVAGTVTANAGTGTFTTAPTATLVDDAAFTPGTTPILMVGATFDDVTPDSINEGDAGAVRMSANRNLYATLRDAAGNERGANINASNQLSVSVDNSPVLGAGTNNIGDVDVLSILPGTGANNLGKAEDGAHTTGDVGVMALAVRTDTPANRSGADGAYEPLQVAAGRLWVSALLDTALPSGTNNIGDVDIASLIPGTGANNLGKAEDAAHTTADVGVMALAVRTDIPANRSGADGDYEPLQVAAGRLWTSTTIDAAIPAGTNNIGDVDIASLPNEGQQTMANSISVAVASDQSAIAVSQATAANLNAQIVGSVAHDSADAGNPVKIGAVARATHPTAVADGDRVNAYADDLGRLVNYPFAPRDRSTHNRITLTSTTETTLIAAGGAGVFRDLIALYVSNESATEVRIDFRDSTAGTVRLSIDLAADGGGAAMPFPVPLTQATANNNWTAQLSAAVSTVYITALAVEQN